MWKIYIVLFFFNGTCLSQNLVKEIGNSFVTKRKGIYSNSIKVTKNDKTKSFDLISNSGGLIGNMENIPKTKFDFGICANEQYEFSIGLNSKLTDGKVYSVKFDIYFEEKTDNSLRRLVFMKYKAFLGDAMKITYAIPCMTSKTKIESGYWSRIEFKLIGDNLNSREICFRMLSITEKEKFVLFRDFCVEESEPTTSPNLILNGGFELFDVMPNTLFFGSEHLFKWQKMNFASNLPCVTSRDSEINESIVKLENDSKLRFTNINLGTPDHIVSSFFWDKNDSSIVAYRGIGMGRLICDESGVSKNNNVSTGEYFQIQLNKELLKGKEYTLKVALALDPNSKLCSNGLGIKFTECPFNPFDSLHINAKILPEPDIVVSEELIKHKEWKLYEFKYVGKGNENYFTIGLFKNSVKNSHEQIVGTGKLPHSYYLIDEISLELAN